MKNILRNGFFLISAFAVTASMFSIPNVAVAADPPRAIEACLSAWGSHPFGSAPRYKTLTTSVRVFGVGKNTEDREVTRSPALVYVSPGVNVMGGTVVELLNPKGWYCLRSTVNVMGGLTIRLHCDAKLAFSSGGTTVMGRNPGEKGITVMGSTTIERVGC